MREWAFIFQNQEKIMSKPVVKFSSIQVSEFLDVMERHNFYLDIESDAKASEMFSELLIVMTLALDEKQVEAYSQAL